MKACIIGLGAISSTHIDALKKNGIEIAAICDVKSERFENAKNHIGADVNTYTDYKAMIDAEKPCVVHVCTPHYLHCDMAVYALESGCDVYLEKPAALTADEAQIIADAEKKTGKKVCVSFQNRVIPTNATAKRLIEEEKYGKLVGIRAEMTWNRGGEYYTASDWRGKWATEGGGILMNQSIHTLDLMYYFGGKVKSLEGSVANRHNKDIIEVEDTAEATLFYENGAMGIFYASNCNVKDSSVQVEIFCEKGTLLLYHDALWLNTDGALEKIIDNIDHADNDGKVCWGNGHKEMMRRFYGNLSGGGEWYCDITDAIPVLRLIGKIYETSANKLR